MTTPTTYDEALEVLKKLTAEHGSRPYFKKAEIVVSDGFHGVDLWVDKVEWKKADLSFKIQVRIDRVPVCYIVEG